MRTKIVYVLSSNKEDLYLSQTTVSAYSLKNKNPDAVVELVVDKKTDMTIVGKRAMILDYIDKKIVVEVPEKYNKVQTSRYLKTNLRNYISGDFLYIDSDTIITDKLDEIDNFSASLGMVLNAHVPISLRDHDLKKLIRQHLHEAGWEGEKDPVYYNGGLIYAKDDDTAKLFFQLWHDKWKFTNENCGWLYDQPSLAVVNEELGLPIAELDGTWNCQILRNGLNYLYKAKIIHFWTSTANRQKKSDEAFLFFDSRIYEDLGEKGFISQELKELIDNAKGGFVTPNRIVVGNELELLGNRLHYFALYYPKVYEFFIFMARCLGFLITQKRKVIGLLGL